MRKKHKILFNKVCRSALLTVRASSVLYGSWGTVVSFQMSDIKQLFESQCQTTGIIFGSFFFSMKDRHLFNRQMVQPYTWSEDLGISLRKVHCFCSFIIASVCILTLVSDLNCFIRYWQISLTGNDDRWRLSWYACTK